MSDSSEAKVTITITKATYDAVLEELRRDGIEEAVMPLFVENILRRWLRSQAYLDQLAKKGKDELTEDEIMELANDAVHKYRDTTLKPKGF